MATHVFLQSKMTGESTPPKDAAVQSSAPPPPASSPIVSNPEPASQPPSNSTATTTTAAAVADVNDVNKHVEIDSCSSDADSAFGAERESSSALLSSSAFDFTYENGRRYHGYHNGAYIMPNDDPEQDRLDLKHHVFRLVLGGKLFLAPIAPDPQRILDIGCGTGIWAIEVAHEYPSAEVIGIDLSPIQPQWVALNCKFIIDNAEDDWPYDITKPFDLIHWRVMAGSVTNWPRLYEQAYRHVKPGGWVEAQEHDIRVSSDDDSIERAKDVAWWFKTIDEASEQFGKKMDVADSQRQWMINAGFVDVRDDVYKVPIGRWPRDKRLKEIGLYFLAQSLDAVEPVSMALFTRVLGYSHDETQIAMIGPRKDMKNPNFHLYIRFHFVTGRKPLPDEVR